MIFFAESIFKIGSLNLLRMESTFCYREILKFWGLWLCNFLIETFGNSCLLYSVKTFWQMYSVIIFFLIWIFMQEFFEFVSVEISVVSVILLLKWFSQIAYLFRLQVHKYVELLFFFRSSHRSCYVRKGVLRNNTKLKHLCQNLFFNKVVSLSL